MLGQVEPTKSDIKMQASLDSLHYLAHNFLTGDPTAMKPHSLETTHPKLSNESIIIEFGSKTRELCLFEVGVAADVNAFNAKTREGV